MQVSAMNTAVVDIFGAFKHYSLVGMLGWQDVRQRYRRSVLGPFWLSISMAVTIGIMWVIFGHIYHVPMGEFLPFLTLGMIFWGFICSVITEGCLGFIVSEHIIKQLPIPLFVHLLRLLWRNLLILAHNFMIFPIVFVLLGRQLSWVMWLSIPGFLLLVMNLMWVVLLLSTLCARYRDVPQIVSSLLQVFFYLTPIMWMPSLITSSIGTYLLNLNPMYHLLSIVRSPMLGQSPTMYNWGVSLLMAFIGWGLTLALYGRFKRRIVYWL